MGVHGTRIVSRRDPIWFTATGSGTARLDLSDDERALLGNLMDQTRMMILGEDQRAWRLFPETYPQDPAMEARHRELVGDDLRDNRLAAIETITSTLDDDEIDADTLDEWVRAINATRLVIGTVLDVDADTDPDDFVEGSPDHIQLAVYDYLTHMLAEGIRALGELGED